MSHGPKKCHYEKRPVRAAYFFFVRDFWGAAAACALNKGLEEKETQTPKTVLQTALYGQLKSKFPAFSTSTQHMELKLSDFRSVVDYKGWRTVERYAFNPRDYPDDQSEQQRRLDFFLESIVPSKFEWPAGVEEARVWSPDYVEDEGLGDRESLITDWEELKLTPNRVNFRTIKELALAHKCLRGTWLLFYKPCERKNRDKEWARIAKATAEGKLGIFAKVQRDMGVTHYFTSVFNSNFTNKEEVMSIERKIRRFGVKGQMVFKPSVFTVLRMFGNNDWSMSLLSQHQYFYTMDFKPSDFMSSENYKGSLYAFNPRDYKDESEQQRRLKYFLESIVPSKFEWPEGVKEARVLSPSYVEDEGLGDRESLITDWEELKLTPDRVNFRTIKELALAHKCLRGKWLLFYKPCERKNQDKEWVRIAQATAEGNLGIFAKVSVKQWDENYITWVHTNNFTNKEEVMSIERKIRSLGVKGQMVFKPSVFTVLRIFANNDWSLNVSTYTSYWEPDEDRSVIKDKTK
ncbi:uncharacterized protein [Asterias amurensis]|uniref:uncharacterized protein isoform X2 n=1 Tax=Asterias amurensis TaxID=7602 RepID=UPI003AB429F5